MKVQGCRHDLGLKKIWIQGCGGACTKKIEIQFLNQDTQDL